MDMKKSLYILICLSLLGLASCSGNQEERNRQEVTSLANRFLYSYFRCSIDSIRPLCTDTMQVRMNEIFNPTSRRDSIVIANVRAFMQKTSHVVRAVDIKGDSATVTYSLITSSKDTLSPSDIYLLKTDEGWKVDAIPENKKKEMKMPEFKIRKHNMLPSGRS